MSLTHLEELTRPQYELLPNNISATKLTNAIVVPGAHELYGFMVSNTNASSQFIQVFDLASLPADGTVPSILFQVSGSSDKGVQWLPARKLLQGLVMCNSSTAGTKTIGASDCFFDIQYL